MSIIRESVKQTPGTATHCSILQAWEGMRKRPPEQGLHRAGLSRRRNEEEFFTVNEH